LNGNKIIEVAWSRRLKEIICDRDDVQYSTAAITISTLSSSLTPNKEFVKRLLDETIHVFRITACHTIGSASATGQQAS